MSGFFHRFAVHRSDIPWPEEEEELSTNSRNAIEILLNMDMKKRAGLKGESSLLV